MQIQLQPEFDDILQPLGSHAAEFFLAASLYHARKISFARAAHMAGLYFDSFKTLLTEHFKQGYIMSDECVLGGCPRIRLLNEQSLLVFR